MSTPTPTPPVRPLLPVLPLVKDVAGLVLLACGLAGLGVVTFCWSVQAGWAYVSLLAAGLGLYLTIREE